MRKAADCQRIGSARLHWRGGRAIEALMCPTLAPLPSRASALPLAWRVWRATGEEIQRNLFTVSPMIHTHIGKWETLGGTLNELPLGDTCPLSFFSWEREVGCQPDPIHSLNVSLYCEMN